MTTESPWLGLVKTKLSEVNKENNNLGGTQALREAINRARKSYVKTTKPTSVINKIKEE